MIGEFGDPDAAGRCDVRTIVRNCDNETLKDSAANGIDTRRSMNSGKQHDEFVATEPGDAIRFSRDRPEARSRFDQQRITGIVAQRVIDVLEPVEVDQQQREMPTLTPSVGEKLAKVLGKHAPVR